MTAWLEHIMCFRCCDLHKLSHQNIAREISRIVTCVRLSRQFVQSINRSNCFVASHDHIVFEEANRVIPLQALISNSCRTSLEKSIMIGMR